MSSISFHFTVFTNVNCLQVAQQCTANQQTRHNKHAILTRSSSTDIGPMHITVNFNYEPVTHFSFDSFHPGSGVHLSDNIFAAYSLVLNVCK